MPATAGIHASNPVCASGTEVDCGAAADDPLDVVGAALLVAGAAVAGAGALGAELCEGDDPCWGWAA